MIRYALTPEDADPVDTIRKVVAERFRAADERRAAELNADPRTWCRCPRCGGGMQDGRKVCRTCRKRGRHA